MELIPLISFFTGVISILSPCILPILPIFVAFSINSKSKSELLSFILGLISIFVAVIFLTGFFTALVYRYVFYVRIVSAVLLLIIGVLMLFDYSFSLKPIATKTNDGLVGSFIFGFLTSIAWAPCYSAYLMSLIAILVSSNNPSDAIFNILLYCFGFALTLLVLSFLISKINLNKFVSKTKYIPKIFSILVIIGAAYMILSLF